MFNLEICNLQSLTIEESQRINGGNATYNSAESVGEVIGYTATKIAEGVALAAFVVSLFA